MAALNPARGHSTMASFEADVAKRAEARRLAHERQAERRRLAHEYVIAVVNAGKILGSPTNHVGMHVPSQDALVGLDYADALIAATTPESEAKS